MLAAMLDGRLERLQILYPLAVSSIIWPANAIESLAPLPTFLPTFLPTLAPLVWLF